MASVSNSCQNFLNDRRHRHQILLLDRVLVYNLECAKVEITQVDAGEQVAQDIRGQQNVVLKELVQVDVHECNLHDQGFVLVLLLALQEARRVDC